jgi:sugar lactone lactonase YvrE
MTASRLFIVTLFLLLAIIPQMLFAQDNITPTPAPSKTPTTEPVTAGEGDAAQPLLQPWTQADLSILTGNVQRPNGIVWHNNKLYVICTGDSTIYELDDSTAETRAYIFGVHNAHTMYAETMPDGELNLWVPDFQTNRLLRVDRNGVETVSTTLAGPWGIARVDEDEFLVTNLQANNTVRINRSGEMTEVLTDLRSPTGIVTHEDYIYVANTGSARRAIEWVGLDETLNASENSPQVQPLVSGLQNVTGLEMAEDGYLYFAYALGTRGVVGRVDPAICRDNGGCSNDQVEIIVYTELAAPLAGLTIAPDMRLFVHTMFSPDIYWVQLGDPGTEELIDD